MNHESWTPLAGQGGAEEAITAAIRDLYTDDAVLLPAGREVTDATPSYATVRPALDDVWHRPTQP